MHSTDRTHDLVLVPVPVPLYPAVMRLIASALPPEVDTPATSSLTSDSAAPMAVLNERGAGAWSASDYAKAGPYLNAFSRAVLDLCASKPGDWVSYRDAVAHGGISHFSARSQLGGLTRRLRLVFDEPKEWPFEYEVAPDRQLSFRLGAASAVAWKKGFVRGGRA